MSIRELLSGQPGLRIGDPRQTTVELHAYLRHLIIGGTFPEGTELKQAELARILAVSRTPLREAFRMLQEEGLISADPNRRSRVLGLNPEQLDSLYAVRITLESLGVRLTAGSLDRSELRAATSCLQEMERTVQADDLAGWAVAHRRFHRLLVCRAGETVLRTIITYAEMSERYVRIDQLKNPGGWDQRHAEHVDILAAVRAGDVDTAVLRLAQHLAGTAFRVIERAAPGLGTPAVLSALELITAHRRPEPAVAGDAATGQRAVNSPPRVRRGSR
ncbi:GntR family transcriptional regulator [Amycolatopsis sp. WQ 127309]|uniref:GntR family transcriptional regulator n=1 Tax=Amycolatopsis sp. WQ 127309 TaxID=2932773 RepID=UPI001FF1408A|nr:GntR family transcriptional regulator [Amycolatopsis sp. WQ 127309]UOZ06945.1 GntR family transcriptional regulator [Amycolatopsis sp. WQ 127309]